MTNNKKKKREERGSLEESFTVKKKPNTQSSLAFLLSFFAFSVALVFFFDIYSYGVQRTLQHLPVTESTSLQGALCRLVQCSIYSFPISSQLNRSPHIFPESRAFKNLSPHISPTTRAEICCKVPLKSPYSPTSARGPPPRGSL